jgi:hypothetical protein
MNATQVVVDGHMEPITKAPITQQLVVTGQELYDTFVVGGEEQRTRMIIIRDLVDRADALQIQGATDKMVEIAKERDEANGVHPKVRGPKRATAMNTRTGFRNIWGAFKFVDAMVQIDAGFDLSTGWNDAIVISKNLLKTNGKVWNGLDVPTDAEREVQALQRKNKAETQALVEVQKDNPRLAGESLLDWNTRVMTIAESAMERARSESLAKLAESEASKLFVKHGEQVCIAILRELATKLGYDLGIESEVTEEEANAALLQAALDEGSVEVVEEETVTE